MNTSARARPPRRAVQQLQHGPGVRLHRPGDVAQHDQPARARPAAGAGASRTGYPPLRCACRRVVRRSTRAAAGARLRSGGTGAAAWPGASWRISVDELGQFVGERVAKSRLAEPLGGGGQSRVGRLGSSVLVGGPSADAVGLDAAAAGPSRTGVPARRSRSAGAPVAFGSPRHAAGSSEPAEDEREDPVERRDLARVADQRGQRAAVQLARSSSGRPG